LINNEAPEVISILNNKSKNTNNIRLVNDPFTDTIELMAAADIMISDYSSVGIEFLALDKPVIFADHLGNVYSDPSLAEIYVRDAGYIVRDKTKFGQTINSALRNPDEKKELRKKYAKHFFGPMDGKAARRGANAIMSLIP
jgi:CDP-glycerol glycerophosphotransferase (TagB/SpsB family)